MPPVAALLLGGLACCCGSPGTASAEVTESSPSLLFAAGVFALVEAYGYPYSVGMTYVARPMTPVGSSMAMRSVHEITSSSIVASRLRGDSTTACGSGWPACTSRTGGLDRPNNSTEALLVTLQVPLSR